MGSELDDEDSDAAGAASSVVASSLEHAAAASATEAKTDATARRRFMGFPFEGVAAGHE